MDEKALFMQFWEKEAVATRKVLERVPEDKCDFRPHPESRMARELANLIVYTESALAVALESGRLEWSEPATPKTMKEVLEHYRKNHDAVTRRLHAVDPSRWAQDIPMFVEGHEVMKDSGFQTAWGILFDQIHHRGQLSTYLRPMGSKVPSIYGPSADEMS